jgi:hypothetical protein
MKGALENLRQLRFPKEFRIARPVWPTGLAPLLRNSAESENAAREKKADDSADSVKLLVSLATRLWRLRRNMVKPGTDEPLEGIGRAYRHLESALEILSDAGLEVQDHTNERVPDHGIYGVKQLAFEPTAGLRFDTVIETVKPTIYYKGQQVQMGEVIVGTPEAK